MRMVDGSRIPPPASRPQNPDGQRACIRGGGKHDGAMRRLIFFLLLAAGLGVRSEAGVVRVAAAASLTLPLTEAGRRFEEATGIEVRLSFGASGALARQIEHGLPVDLFLSAHPDWMTYLAERDRIDDRSRRPVVRNRLVVVVPEGSDLTLASLDDLGRAGRIAVGDPAVVPAGRYAMQALTSAGLADTLADRLLPAANVRAALAYVARNEVDAGFVYRTDGLADPRVRIAFEVDPARHDPILYPAAWVAGAKEPALADRFLNDLLTGPGAGLLRDAGFLPPSDPP